MKRHTIAIEAAETDPEAMELLQTIANPLKL